jgi:hypothetical protein
MTVKNVYQAMPLVKKQYPCLDTLSTVNTIVSTTSTLDRAVEHRVKPDPLTLTTRGLQYTDVRTTRQERQVLYPAYGCPGGLTIGTQTDWKYGLPTQPIVPCEAPDWALAFRNKLQDDKVSFAEQIGEWREAVSMMSDGVGVMKRAFRAVKRIWRNRRHVRNWRKWYKTTFKRPPSSKWELQDAISVHLMIKFGITPMLTQLEDVMVQLDRYLLKTRRIQVTLKTRGAYSAGGRYGGTYSIERVRSTRVIAFVTYDMDNREFTSGNIGEALWAGTKLSFVVDWFWDVSSYLSSFNALKGVTSLQGVICRRDTVKGIDRRVQFGPGYKVQTPGTWNKKSYQRDKFGITDIPISSLPKPRLPDTDLWSRWLTLREILSSVRHGIRNR